MRKIFTILLIVNVQWIYGQSDCSSFCLNFEDTACIHHLFIDTSTFQQNTWQIGQPQKPLFNTVTSSPNVIITDTLLPYPTNDHSSFIIRTNASMGDIYGFRMLVGNYFVQSDSLNDYGLMEFSPDKGTTWIDLVNDTLFNAFVWYSPKPVLTGNSNGWMNFDVLLADIGSVFHIQLGDTLLYRFSFISDGNPDNLGGLMYDDLCFSDFVEGISETRFKPIKSKIYPNPSNQLLTIEFENPGSELFELAVYDIHSKPILKKENIPDNRITLNTSTFQPGIYVYKITNLKAKKRCWGKFIVS